MNTKSCKKCGDLKPLQDFVPSYGKASKDGTRNLCWACHYGNAKKRYNDRKNERTPEWYRIRNLKRDHDLTIEAYDSIAESQEGKCAICNQISTGKRLNIDHDHRCCPPFKSCQLCRRGLLCHNCNIGLGNFNHDIHLLSKAIKYQMKSLKENQPILLGLCGKAGTGKTSVANLIVPKVQVLVQEEDEAPIIELDHFFFAMPLYEIANLKRFITGEKARERKYFEIHNVLYDLFGGSPLYGVPDYKDFVALVETIVDMPIERDLDKKPRSFLQDVGTLCREIQPDCFVSWVRKNVTKRGYAAIEQDREYLCVVSDIRMSNEAEMIAKQPNGVVIKFEASDEIRHDRLMNRDGFLMSETQAAHSSEDIDAIPDELIMATLNTDGMTLPEQTIETKKLLNKCLEGVNLA